MIDRWAIDFTDAAELGQFRHIERDGHHYLALRDDIRADGQTLADAWADMADQLAQQIDVADADLKAADARAQAGLSEMMKASEAVERYGERLIGEYVAVQVWGVDLQDPGLIETKSTWLSAKERLYVLNVPEGGQNDRTV